MQNIIHDWWHIIICAFTNIFDSETDFIFFAPWWRRSVKKAKLLFFLARAAAPAGQPEPPQWVSVCCCDCLCCVVTSQRPVQHRTHGCILGSAFYLLIYLFILWHSWCDDTLLWSQRSQRPTGLTPVMLHPWELEQTEDSSQIKDSLKLNGLKGSRPQGGIRRVWLPDTNIYIYIFKKI